MRAVVFTGKGGIEVQERPDPMPGPDEVVIRMKASGMCGSDLHHLQGPLRTGPELVIEGHEPCGRQSAGAIPSVRTVLPNPT